MRALLLCLLGAILTWLSDGYDPQLGCHIQSKELHTCVNIFLERDFPFIEAFLKRHETNYRNHRARRPVLIEGPDMENICQRLLEMEECMLEVKSDCYLKAHFKQFVRLLAGFGAVRSLACSENMEVMKELLIHGACIERVSETHAECHQDNMNWSLMWKRMLRLQEMPENTCPPLKKHVRCLVNAMSRSHCGLQATNVFNRTMSTWLETYCKGTSLQSWPLFLFGVLVTVLSIASRLTTFS